MYAILAEESLTRHTNRISGSVLLQTFIAPLGMFLVMNENT